MPFVGEKIFEGGKEKSAEAASFGVEAAQVIALEEAGEETLGEVFGILAGITAAANISIERIPIVAAEFSEGLFRLRRRTLAGGDDRRPVRGGEGIVWRRNGCCMIGGHLGSVVCVGSRLLFPSV